MNIKRIITNTKIKDKVQGTYIINQLTILSQMIPGIDEKKKSDIPVRVYISDGGNPGLMQDSAQAPPSPPPPQPNLSVDRTKVCKCQRVEIL